MVNKNDVPIKDGGNKKSGKSTDVNASYSDSGKATQNKGHEKERIKELEEKLRKLALTIDTVEDEKLIVEEKLKKALADYHNLERNNERRNEIRLNQIKKDLAASMINLMDDIYYGLNAKEELEIPDTVASWLDGLAASMSKMKNVLGELGITLLEVKEGDKFDSNIHEAIAMVDGGKKGRIVDVVQPGYIMDEQIIRPAKVVVGK